MSGAAPGQRLGPYELQSIIGAGGMGEVWKARDTRLNRMVAIKFAKAQFSDRFTREARAIAALSHPHICTLYDVGSDYLVMEYIDGKPVKGPLPLAKALAVAVEITDALDAAHTKEIIHRDLKPGNILVTKSGVKLLDFGLAKHSQTTFSPGDLTPTQEITETGTILGTLNYMSPEQAEGKDADPRSDIFSFGCVLYELITGTKAFDGRSAASVIASLLTAEPAAVSSTQPLVPPALERVVRRCLAKDPDARWQSARDLRDELKWIAESDSDAPTVATKPLRLSVVGTIVAAVAILVAIGTALSFWRASEPKEPAQVVRFSLNPPNPRYPSISPDGRHIAYVAGKDRDLWIQDLDQNEPRSVAGSAGAQRPFWSPDSAFIAFALGGELKKTPVAGGPLISICGLPNPAFYSGSWSPDGEWIVFGARGTSNKGGGLYRVAARGGTATIVIADSPELIAPRDPYFLPIPGNRLVFLFVASTTKGNVPVRTWIHDMNTGEHHLLGGADGQFPAYSRSGHILYWRIPGRPPMWAAPFSLKTLKITGESFPVADSDFAFSVSNTDTLVYVERNAPVRQLIVRDRAGRKTGVVGNPVQELDRPALSPDGTRVAFAAADGLSSNVWIAEVDRPVKTPVTFARAESRDYYYDPVWSPSGDRVAYTASIAGRFSIKSKPADGSGAETELATSPTRVQIYHWYKPDQISVNRSDLIGSQLGFEFIKVPASSLADARKGDLLPYSEFNARVSPDGALAAFLSTRSGRALYIRPMGQSAGGKLVSEADSGPRWRRDGKELFYTQGKSLMAVPVTRTGAGFDIGKPQVLFTVDSGFANGYDVWPDGQRFIVPEPIEGSKSPVIRVVQNWHAAFAPNRSSAQ